MRRARLRRLRVTGPGKPPAEIAFHPVLTFITGASNTGKSHIFKCVDYALGGPEPQRNFNEVQGYERVYLEVGREDGVVTIRRSFGDDTARWFDGTIEDWDEEAADEIDVPVDRAKPHDTLGGRVLDTCGFDPSLTVVRNQRGQVQALSFRTMSGLVLVSEAEVIAEESPVAPPSFSATADLSTFSLVISGKTPTDEEIKRLRAANQRREHANQQLQVLEPLVKDLREEIEAAGLVRPDLERDVAAIDEELGKLSEQVAASGDAVRERLRKRNEALTAAQKAHESRTRESELRSRFDLLAEHYRTDVQRLEFVLEGGHFFQQLNASHCPRCGRPLGADEDCHPESADFEAIEHAARAELAKLTPRMNDLEAAIADVDGNIKAAVADEERWRQRAQTLDMEIREVASPTAEHARARVRALAEQRRAAEEHLLRFRELDRYLAMMQEADITKQQTVDKYRPVQDAVALRSLQAHTKRVLEGWQFPITSDVIYDVANNDLVIDGKPRAANGKGVRAVTHAAFKVALMQHCYDKETPHPGFVVIDSPLTPYRGAMSDDEEDAVLRAQVREASLRWLAATEGCGQVVIIENIDPPVGLNEHAEVVVFSGQPGQGQPGFYPVDRQLVEA